ncbi:hypothetical protein GS4_05_00580 [Gordonia soli NBRC 108243]|uniref:Uncharacterized protein n=1 Tax=Gordonia soli NBRC 108243 TaxID=1223545 RepID=M0QEJ8_9ACTN|nr:hypothetical protein GS4_05_00580 [Gordonia soli NBRC 108243]
MVGPIDQALREDLDDALNALVRATGRCDAVLEDHGRAAPRNYRVVAHRVNDARKSVSAALSELPTAGGE